MAVTIYRSDDADAPVITGLAGNLGFINVLKACLVNGYGSKSPAGWAVAYESGSKAAFRAAVGRRYYLAVDETSAQYPVLRGYRTMSAVDVGTEPFPSLAQLAGGIRPVKSITTTNIPRPWVVVASQTAFYFLIGWNWTDMSTQNSGMDTTMFGDIVSYLPGDIGNVMLIGKTTADTTANNTRFGVLAVGQVDLAGHYLASDYLQTANPATCGILAPNPPLASAVGTAGPAYPSEITGGMLLDYLRICEGQTAKMLTRGHLPGAFNPLHNLPGNHLDQFSGRGSLTGHDFVLLYRGGSTIGRFALSLDEADWAPTT